MVKGKESPSDLDNSVRAEATFDKGKTVLPMLAHDINDFNIVRTEDILTSDNVDFKSLLLPDFILNGLSAANFHKPSPIQLRSIPLLRLGFDLIVQSKAGTGKTLVIALAALETVKLDSKRLQAIVVAPTHEIALQTKHFISIISSDVAVRTEAFIGGTSVKVDRKNTLGCQIAIGTPGRLNSLIEKGDMSLNYVRLFVLDEADKLMEKSIFSQIRSISKLLPDNKQTILCSATFLHPVKDYVVKHMKEPFWVTPEKATRLQPGQMENQTSTSTVLLGVTQFFKELPNHAQIIRKLKFKLEEILDILSGHPFTQCIIFSNYQTRAETICHQLVANGWPAMSVRGQDDQTHRTATLNSFKELQSRVLLTTDVMSRGVDFRGVDLVINLDIPYDSATYLHRMGRAGRFGSYGCVITLASTGAEVESFKKILSEVTGTVVYYLPTDFSHIKDVNKLESVFFQSPQESFGEHMNSENLVKTEFGSEPDLISEDLTIKNLKSQNGCIVNRDDATSNNIVSCEQTQVKNVEKESEPKSGDRSKAAHLDQSKSVITEDLKKSLPHSFLSSPSKLNQCTPASSRMLFNCANLQETTVKHAITQLSTGLSSSERQPLTFHSFDDLEKMLSNWTVDGKNHENESSPSEKKLNLKDWWPSANIVLTAANLQLQESIENALKTPNHLKDVKCDTSDSSSADSYFQSKTYAKKSKKGKTSRKNFKSSSHQQIDFSAHTKEQKDNLTADSQDDTYWLWDESSKLYYIWDENHSCYHLYNPDLKCCFKWEPGLNKYYKWDDMSQKFKLWDCESGCFSTRARTHAAQESKLPMGNSYASKSRNMSDQNYLSWFTMWNKKVRQMSMQVYQAEYLKNLCGTFHNS